MKINNETPSNLEKELNLLSVFHFVIGGMILVSSVIPVLVMWSIIGFSFVQSGMSLRDESIGVALISIIPVLTTLIAILMIHSGFCIKKKQNFNKVRVMSLLILPAIPGGTILGVVCLIYLNKWKEVDGIWKLKDLEKNKNHNNAGVGITSSSASSNPTL